MPITKCLNPIKQFKPGRLSRRAALICLPLVVLLAPGSASAASRVWDGGCGPDTAWSCAGNWSGDAVPGPADTATFSAKSPGDSTVDPAFPGVVAAIRLNPGYEGTILQEEPTTVSKTFTQRSGGFDAGGENLAVKALTLSGGTFVASSATTSIGGVLNISGSPAFDANGGTVNFDGAGGTLNCDGVAFNQVTISNATGTKTVGGDCDLPLGEEPEVDSGGSIKLNGTLSGAGTLTTSKTLTLGSGGSLSGFSGLVTEFLTVNGKYDFGSFTTFAVNRTFSLNSGGRFTAPAGDASFAGKFVLADGADFDADGGTLTFDGTASTTLTCGNKAFSLVSFTHTAGIKTVGSDCDLPLGKNPEAGSGGSIKLNGTLSGVGTLTTSKTLTLSNGGSLSGFSGLAADKLVVSGKYDFGSYADFSVGGAFVIGPGGNFTAPAGVASFAGDFANGGNGFVANGGTVVLDGEYQELSGSTTFGNLVKRASSAETLTFAAGSIFAIRGMLTLEGVSEEEPLRLASSAPGKPWLINAMGPRNVQMVLVSDSVNRGEPIQTNASFDGGGNVGWVFNELIQVVLELLR